MGLYWLPVVLFGLTALSSAFFFVLHLSTNEHVPLERARALYRWAVVTFLATFDFWIFARIVDGIRLIW